MKYTKEDVIIWTDDPRLEGSIGKECYSGHTPVECLSDANEEVTPMILKEIKKNWNPYPYELIGNKAQPKIFAASCIIIKKEPEKKIVPFDLSLEEDRNALMGKVVRWTRNRDEREGEDDRADIFMINTFARDIQDVEDESQDFWCTFNIATGFLDGEDLLEEYVFADGENKGKPVGKEVDK